MGSQPAGSFASDAELSAAFTPLADAVEAAIPAFPPAQAAVLERYLDSLQEYIADPSSDTANKAMYDMLEPMASLTTEIATECGVDTVNLDD